MTAATRCGCPWCDQDADAGEWLFPRVSERATWLCRAHAAEAVDYYTRLLLDSDPDTAPRRVARPDTEDVPVPDEPTDDSLPALLAATSADPSELYQLRRRWLTSRLARTLGTDWQDGVDDTGAVDELARRVSPATLVTIAEWCVRAQISGHRVVLTQGVEL